MQYFVTFFLKSGFKGPVLCMIHFIKVFYSNMCLQLVSEVHPWPLLFAPLFGKIVLKHGVLEISPL